MTTVPPFSASARGPSHPRGLTLTELMITIAVLAVLLAVALPSFRSNLDDRRLSGAATGLASLIESASSRAHRGEQVTLSCTSGTEWVCTESGGTGPTVRTAGADYPGTTLTINQTIGGQLIAQPRRPGFAKTVTDDPLAGATWLTVALGGKSVNVIITAQGEARLCPSTPLPGIPACES